MFHRWGYVVHRRWITVLVAGALFVAVAAWWGTGVFGALSGGGFEDPESESAAASAQSAEVFGRTAADVVVLYEHSELTVDDPQFRAAVTDTLDDLPRDEVERAISYYDTGSPAFVSGDRHATYAAITLVGDDDDELDEHYQAVKDDLAAPGLETSYGGPSAVFFDVGDQVGEDIGRAEAVSLPIVLVLCLLILGGLVAAVLPLVVGGIAILGAFTLLRVLSLFTDVSVFAINVITLLGLGLAIDYALFMVSRFREELPGSATVADAIARTMATAGRTVAFSGLIVASALASLLLFPQNFLQSMGFGGMAAVLVAMAAALTVLPALLAVLGHRVDALALPWRRPQTPAESDNGGWAVVARSVMRRPVVYAVSIVIVLLAIGAPFLRVNFGSVDERVLPETTESGVVAERLTGDFPGGDASAAEVMVTGASGASLSAYVDQLGSVPGVGEVTVSAQRAGAALLVASYAADPQSEEARQLVERLRNVDPPPGATAVVGGETAQLVDLLDSLASTLPVMALLVVLIMFALLFIAFGSIVLPIKAVIMNAISIVASFGVVVWVFQDGNLADLLGFTPTGFIDATQPILMLAILFGLSMDYEVFLLSRVREAWDQTHDNTEAVAIGLQRTGRIITSAALLLVVVIGAFATSGITFIKLVGVGMIVAIFVDATVVRALLVPATMRLLGSANWWAPGPMRRWWDRFGLRESTG